MRGALDARREALSELSSLATELLRDAGHNPTSDMLRRITSTLEGVSAYASLPDAPAAGRLTHDVDPPGFESFSSLIPGAVVTQRAEEPARVTSTKKSVSASTNTRRKTVPGGDLRQLEKTRQAKIAVAKVSLQDAKRALIKARTRAQSAESAQKKAQAHAKETEKQRREAEQRFEKARAASEGAAQRAQNVAAEVEEAVMGVEEAERTVAKAAKEIESLSRELPDG
jgi:type IV secretory pathway VirB10-like protein